MVTMLLGGLWHGAGWTFVIWGALHGTYLVINNGWWALRRRMGGDTSHSTLAGKVAGSSITFLAVVIAWVFFRAENVASALRIIRGMTGLQGTTLSPEWLSKWVMTGQWVHVYYWIPALLAVAFFMPNSQTLLEGRTAKMVFSKYRSNNWTRGQFLNYFVIGSLLIIITLLALINSAKGASEFIYFNF
jgi:hypothetical protein